MTDFHHLILSWYAAHKRDLPWRHSRNPYHIWLSEIILQQTRVDQGMSYFLKFVRNYPSVGDLAAASEQQVLNDWQGLGYYSRARNLHATARFVQDHLQGVFPDSFAGLTQLKGVGNYTAAAIASFCFDEPCAVVDGNVLRVLSRLFDVDLPIDSSQGKKAFDAIARDFLNEADPAQHNQAIMEFGALQCVPRNPNCAQCPLQLKCMAYANQTVELRPVKAGKTKIRKRFFHYLYFRDNGKILLEKRTGRDIWQHLFQFPLIEADSLHDPEQLQACFEHTLQLQPAKYQDLRKHILSHQHIHARIWFFDRFPEQISANWLSITADLLQDYPLPQLLVRFLEQDQESLML